MVTIEFKIPVRPQVNGKRPRKGSKAFNAVEFEVATGVLFDFEIGGQKVAFVLQDDGDTVAHYASGYKACAVKNAHLAYCVSSGDLKTPIMFIARLQLSRALDAMGAEKLLEKLNSVPAINS